MAELSQRIQEAATAGRRAVSFGIFANVSLAFIKTLTGIFGQSQALIADGLESALDAVSSILIWGALKYAERPADKEHPYGHGKMETLASLGGSLFLLLAGGIITVTNLNILFRYYTGQVEEMPVPKLYTLVILGGIILVKEGLFQYISRRAKKIQSRSMEADAHHHRFDAITSLAAFIGISIALIGGSKWAVADNWAALFACALIVFNGFRLFKNSLSDALDRQEPEELVEEIRQRSLAVSGVRSVEKVRLRRSGLSRIADLHVRVDGDLRIREGHEISHRVVDTLLAKENLKLSEVTVHIEPEPEVAQTILSVPSLKKTFDQEKQTQKTRRNLPHWTQEGVTYWVTLRLADSIPLKNLKAWREEKALWISKYPKPWTKEQRKEYNERFGRRFEKWLDAGSGECFLRQPNIRAVVQQCLLHYENKHYELSAWVIMPNHVHMLIKPYEGWTLSKILQGIKGVSAKECNLLLGRVGKTFWQDESFDHIVRSQIQFERFLRYIEENPQKAHLKKGEFSLSLMA
ncbi:MAG: cation diffusion facilitator family transporter [Chthoniobacterales bacterium]